MNDKILERVRLLLARAEHPNTPAPEAELALQQANKMMVKHAIDEALLQASMSKEEREAPERRDIQVGYDSAGEFWPSMTTILLHAAEANRCQAQALSNCTVAVFGFREDLSWVEMLYTMILSDFVQQVNPKWDSNKPFEQNVYNFKVAGYKWADINRIAMDNGNEDHENKKTYTYRDSDGTPGEYTEGTGYYHKLKRIYTKYAQLVGDEDLVKTTSFQQYREQFTAAYKERMAQRLHAMRRESETLINETSGAEVALLDRSHLIDEAVWDAFPSLHPDARAARREQIRQRHEQELREREEMLAAMTPAARRKFLEKEEREARRNYNRGVRYVQYQSAAANRGRSAANAVDLSKKRHTSGASTKGEIQ